MTAGYHFHLFLTPNFHEIRLPPIFNAQRMHHNTFLFKKKSLLKKIPRCLFDKAKIRFSFSTGFLL